jgi:hypothetical protein
LIVAGIGCRKGASAVDIGAAIDNALTRAGLAAQALDLIAAPEFKGREHGIAAAAVARGVPLVLVAQAELEAALPPSPKRQRWRPVARRLGFSCRGSPWGSRPVLWPSAGNDHERTFHRRRSGGR